MRNLLTKIGISYDITKVLNSYYEDDFRKVALKDRAVMLPHCLISKKCPARFSKEDGIMCIKCGLCRCGEIKKLCEEKGYQFYITPSVGFTKRLIARKKIKAVIGATCIYEVSKGLRSEKIDTKGLGVERSKVTPYAIMISKYDCIDNDMDWNSLIQVINSI